METGFIWKAPARAFLAVCWLAFVAAGCATSGGESKVRVTEEKQYIRLNHVQDTSQLTQQPQSLWICLAMNGPGTLIGIFKAHERRRLMRKSLSRPRPPIADPPTAPSVPLAVLAHESPALTPESSL